MSFMNSFPVKKLLVSIAPFAQKETVSTSANKPGVKNSTSVNILKNKQT